MNPLYQKVTMGNLLSAERANKILAEAYGLLIGEPSLRLGQAICIVYGSDIEGLFNEENPSKACELFYNLVENSGKRKLTGKLNLGNIYD